MFKNYDNYTNSLTTADKKRCDEYIPENTYFVRYERLKREVKQTF